MLEYTEKFARGILKKRGLKKPIFILFHRGAQMAVRSLLALLILFSTAILASGAGISGLPGPPSFTPIPPINPFSPTGSGVLGQSSGTFAPPAPLSTLPVSPLSTPVLPPALGIPPGSFAPAPPVLSGLGPNLGGALVTGVGGAVSAPVQPFSMGPATLLNQFAQPPLVPFGQVGIPPAAYNPSLSQGNANPFSLTCNYYFFVNCGASGGQAQNFKYSTR